MKPASNSIGVITWGRLPHARGDDRDRGHDRDLRRREWRESIFGVSADRLGYIQDGLDVRSVVEQMEGKAEGAAPLRMADTGFV